jgi:hypothetical protein
MPFLRRLDLRGGFTRGVGRSATATSAAVSDGSRTLSGGTAPALRRSKSLSFGVVAVAVALGVGAAGAAPIISTTQTEVTIGGLSCGTQYRVRVNVAGDSEVTTLNPVTKPCPGPQPAPPPGEVRWRKTFESPYNSVKALEETNCQELPNPTNFPYCAWSQIANNTAWAVVSTSDPFAGLYSIDLRLPANTCCDQRNQIGHMRSVWGGKHDYFRFVFKLDPNWTETSDAGDTLLTMNYQNIYGSPLFMNVDELSDSAYVVLVSGHCEPGGNQPSTCDFYGGQPIGGGFAPRPAGFPGPLYVIPPGQLQKNAWHDLIIHVYWTPYNEGVIEAWHRLRGGIYTKTLDFGPVGSGRVQQFNAATLQNGLDWWGDVQTVEELARDDVSIHTTQDKIGQRLGQVPSDPDGWISSWEEFCRASSRGAAETCLG